MNKTFIASLYRGIYNRYEEERVFKAIEDNHDVSMVDRRNGWVERWERLPDWDEWNQHSYEYKR